MLFTPVVHSSASCPHLCASRQAQTLIFRCQASTSSTVCRIEPRTPQRTKVHPSVNAPPSTDRPHPLRTPSFWSYRAPVNYSAPRNYRSPRTYQAPVQYGPTSGKPLDSATAGVKADASGPGSSGGSGIFGGGDGNHSGGSGPGGSGPEGNDESASGGSRGRMQPVTVAFALFVLVGGIMGYKKKRSKDSLIASSIITGLLLVSALLMGRPDTTYGVRLALVTTGSLAAYMGKGFYDKRKVFPQGVLTVVSLVLTIGYIGSL